jgi:hypothetical protein
LIQQIFILEQVTPENEALTKKIDEARGKLHDSLSLPVENYLHQSRCFKSDLQKLQELAKEIPPYTEKDYAALPQFYVATASLLLFVNSDELALKVLQDAQKKTDKNYHDYTLPFLHSKIMYYFGEPVESYKYLLDDMIQRADETLDLTNKVKDRCASPSSKCDSDTDVRSKELQARAQRSKRIAMNSIAYGIAQDLAARIPSADDWEPVAQEYAEKLADAVKKREGSKDDPNLDDETDDTIAFVTLVIEGRKSNRDITKIKEAIAKFKLVIGHQEDAMKKPDHVVSKRGRSILNSARAHLSSAQELLEE